MAQGLSGSTACGNYLDQALTPHLLHWQADSLSLSHRRGPRNHWECRLHGGIFFWFDKLEISYIQCPTCLFLLLWSHRKHKNEPNPKLGLDTGTDDMLWECLLTDEAFYLEHYRLPTDGNFSACPDRQHRKQLALKSKGISCQTSEKPQWDCLTKHWMFTPAMNLLHSFSCCTDMSHCSIWLLKMVLNYYLSVLLNRKITIYYLLPKTFLH